MNYTDRKTLTEFLGECWHEPIFVRDNPVEGHFKCSKCGIELKINKSANRTFTTPDDFFDLVARLRETGKWVKFRVFAFKTWWNDPTLLASMPYDSTINAIFEDWLLDPARFCELVAEWLKKEER